MRLSVLFVAFFASLAVSGTLDLTGRIISNDSLPVPGATVRLARAAKVSMTDSEGRFHISNQSTRTMTSKSGLGSSVEFSHGIVTVMHSSAIRSAQLCIFNSQGKRLFFVPVLKRSPNAWSFNLQSVLPQFMRQYGMYIIRLRLNEEVHCFKIQGFDRTISYRMTRTESSPDLNRLQKTTSADAIDTLIIRKTGRISRRLPINGFNGDLGDIRLGNQFSIIDTNLVDVEYSPRLDLIVGVCNRPGRTVLFNPQNELKKVIQLNKPPTCVSVSLDGGYAAVGHDAMISYIDLEGKTLLKEYTVSCAVSDIVLGQNGYAYSFPGFDQWVDMYRTNLTSGAETSFPTIYEGTKGKLHPNGKYIYTTTYAGRFNADAGKWDKWQQETSFFMNNDLWISEDGSRIFTAGGAAYAFNENQNLDMKYAGNLCNAPRWVSHSSRSNYIAAIKGDSLLCFFNPKYLTILDSIFLKPLVSSVNWSSINAQFAFFSQDGNACAVIFSGVSEKKRYFSSYIINDDQYPKNPATH